MLKVGVQSGCLYEDDHVDEGLRMLKEAGFDCVDFNIDTKLSYRKVCDGEPCAFFRQSDEALKAYYAPHKAAIEKYGVTYQQMHAPFPLYKAGNDMANDELFNSVVKCLMLCDYLGCPYLIVHPIAIPEDPTGEEEWSVNIDFYTRLIPYAKQYGVKICLENMFFGKGGLMTEAVCSDMGQTVDMIDALNETAGEEIFAFCMDLGHLTLLGKHIRRTINQLGNRLQTLHLHDNDGRQDLHMQPYAYKRSDYVTDWQGLIEGLRDIRFQGALSFETYNAVRTLPKELHFAMAKYIASVGKFFAAQIEQEA